MSKIDEDFFAGYAPAKLNEPVQLTVTKRDLMLIQMGLDILLRETSRHDHIFHDIRAVRAKCGQILTSSDAPAR